MSTETFFSWPWASQFRRWKNSTILSFETKWNDSVFFWRLLFAEIVTFSVKKTKKRKLINEFCIKSWRKFHRWNLDSSRNFKASDKSTVLAFVCFSSLLLILTKWLRMNRQYWGKAYLTPAKLLKDPSRGFGATAFPAMTNNEQARVLCSCKRIPVELLASQQCVFKSWLS